MTATEELRRMLDERGVEWGIADYSKHKRMTVWRVDGMEWNYFEDDKTGWTVLSSRSGYLTTPAQAIAATLGRGTCHMRLVYEEEDADGFIWPNHYECDACGANVNGIMPRFQGELMNDMELMSLTVLGAASELYNCSEILRDAIESDDDDQFSAEYIDGERNMVRNAAMNLRTSIDVLLEELGVNA